MSLTSGWLGKASVASSLEDGGRNHLNACPESVDSPVGRQRVFEHLKAGPYPHYKTAVGSPGLLVRIEVDGERTVGRFVNRQFQRVNASAKKNAKPAFLKTAVQQGYTVVLCFIGIADVNRSKERVAMRVSKGGRDVPNDKLTTWFQRTMNNLKLAIQEHPCVLILDNDDLWKPYRLTTVSVVTGRFWQSRFLPGFNR